MAGFRAYKKRLLEETWQREHARKTAELRARLAGVRDRIRKARARAVELCRARRHAVSVAIAARRLELRALLAQERAMRTLAARAACAARKGRVKAAGRAERARLAAERAALALERRRELDHLGKRRRELARQTAAERRGSESDDEVRQNIPAELVPLWNRVRRKIRGTARRSRTEAFLEWVEENPGEVFALEGEAADRETRRLVAELQKAERAAAREKPSRRAVAAALAAELGALGLEGPGLRKAVRSLVGGVAPPPVLAERIRRRAADLPVAARSLELAESLGAVPF